MKLSHFTTKVNRGPLILLTMFALAACGRVIEPPIQPSAPDTEAVNTSLETMAKTFAKAVESLEVRQQIHTLVGERFDGDTNVLYKTLVGAPQAQSSIRQALAAAYGQSELSSQVRGARSLEAIEGLASNIPRFQVAVPVLFDKWDAERYVPLVGYVPAGIDDKDMKEIKAFDAQGNTHVLDAQRLPQQPVIILSQNERTDESGALLPAFAASKAGTASSISELTPQSHCRSVFVRYIRLFTDHEPPYKGGAELYLRARSTPYSSGISLSYHAGFTDVNDAGPTYYVNRYIGCAPNFSTVTFTWYEQDGPFDNDDLYGSKSAYYTLFNGINSWFSIPGMTFSTN